jgi:HSP20 family protein
MENKKNIFNRRRINRDLDDFFFSSWNPFSEFQEYFNHMTQELSKNGTLPSPKDGGPYIYGWSYYRGPDGKPIYQEFSNMSELQRPRNNTPVLSEKNEPFVDVIESEKEVYITVELPGIPKENIKVEMTKNSLILSVKHPDRGFKKEVQLPSEVEKTPVEATYNNGVLSITLQKRKEIIKGRKINIK